MPAMPVAMWSKANVFSRFNAGIAGSNTAEGKDVSFLVDIVCCVVSGLCDGLITRPEKSYRVCVYVCVIWEPQKRG